MHTASMVRVVSLLCKVYAVSLLVRLTSGCPTWYSNTTGHCECGDSLGARVICHKEAERVDMLVGFCMTFDYNTQTELAGACPYGYTTNMTNRMFSLLPKDPTQLNETTYGPYNREGLLCGQCIEGFGPAPYSTDLRCANCTDISTGYAIILYLVLEFVPITFFFFLVAMFHINITSGPMLGYVLFCQGWTFVVNQDLYWWQSVLSPLPSYLKTLAQVPITLADMWNLHFLRYVLPSLCLSHRMSNIHVNMLGFITSVYPVLLMLITFIAIDLYAKDYRCVRCLGKPFHMCFVIFQKNWNASDSVIHAFATFIVLSSYTLTCNTVAVISYVSVFDVNGTLVRTALYYDPSVVMFSTEHILYIIIAAMLFLILSVCPALLLCLYPTRVYEKVSRYCSARKRLAVKTFAEAIHCCFKNGLNGTKDYRASAGFIIMIPILMLVAHMLFSTFVQYLLVPILYGILSLFTSFFVSCLRPCKSLIMNVSLSFHAMLSGILFITSSLWLQGYSFSTEILAVMFAVLIVLPHIVILMWIFYKLVHYMNSDDGHYCKRVLTTLKKVALPLCKRHDYQELCGPMYTTGTDE